MPSSNLPDSGRQTPIIRMAGVSKSYGSTQVIRDLDLEVYPGERIAIIGPSGSGKTTLLRLLMTLETPSSGSIEVDGQRLELRSGFGHRRANRKQLRALRSKLGMVFQHFNLFPHMTVLENLVEGPVHVLGLKETDARDRAMRLLERVGLAGYDARYPRQLSGGQQQRVGIARALAMEPKVILFDEVTSALDPELVGEVLGVIRSVAETSRMTMMLVTHEMNFARLFADRVVFMEGGQIIEQGPPSQIFSAPSSARCRQFLHAVLDPLESAEEAAAGAPATDRGRVRRTGAGQPRGSGDGLAVEARSS